MSKLIRVNDMTGGCNRTVYINLDQISSIEYIFSDDIYRIIMNNAYNYKITSTDFEILCESYQF